MPEHLVEAFTELWKENGAKRFSKGQIVTKRSIIHSPASVISARLTAAKQFCRRQEIFCYHD